MNKIFEPELDEYKGHPVLKIPTGGGFFITLGLTKATAILENIEVIERFVETEGKSIEPESE